MSDSPKGAAAFLHQLSADEAFRARINAATSTESLLSLAISEGYQFDRAELRTALDAHESESATLSDSDLDAVSGGLLKVNTDMAAWMRQLLD